MIRKRRLEYAFGFLLAFLGLNFLKIYLRNSRLEKLFEKRKKILQRSCSVKSEIYRLKKSKNSSFSELLDFHKKVHDLEASLEDVEDTSQCGPRFPGFSRSLFDLADQKILACLVPKCGTTSFHRGKAYSKRRKMIFSFHIFFLDFTEKAFLKRSLRWLIKTAPQMTLKPLWFTSSFIIVL